MLITGIWRTAITGAVLLVPVLALLYFGVQIFMMVRGVFLPIVDYLNVERALGLIVLNILVVAMLGVLCFAAGLAARMSFIADRVDALDRTLAKRVPGYSIIVGVIRGAIDDDVSVDRLRTVPFAREGGHRIGFEVESASNGNVVVFLPNVPNPQTGKAMAFSQDDVVQLDVPAHRVFEMLQFFGKGVADVVEVALSAQTAGQPSTAENPSDSRE